VSRPIARWKNLPKVRGRKRTIKKKKPREIKHKYNTRTKKHGSDDGSDVRKSTKKTNSDKKDKKERKDKKKVNELLSESEEDDSEEDEDSDYDPDKDNTTEKKKQNINIIFGFGPGGQAGDEEEMEDEHALMDEEECDSDDEKMFMKETYQPIELPEQISEETKKLKKTSKKDKKKSKTEDPAVAATKSKFETEYKELTEMKKYLAENSEAQSPE
jgi:hypothetical protein